MAEKEYLGNLEVYDVENPDIDPSTENIEPQKEYKRPGIKEKWESYKAERAVKKAVKREAYQSEKKRVAGERFQARVERARESGISAARGRVAQRPQGFRTKTVYKKVGKHYKKVTRRIAIKHKAGSSSPRQSQGLDLGFNFGSMVQPKQSSNTNFFGGLNGIGQGQRKKGKQRQQGGIAGFRIGF